MFRFTNFLLTICLAKIAFAEFTSVSLTGRLAGTTLEHQVNLNDPNANGQDTITIRYTVPQTTWVSVGVNPTGGGMVNGEVIIAKPADNTILKYKMAGKSGSTISELPNQTLINQSLQQTNGNTILTFTKILNEPGEFAISPGETNTFIAAFGRSNNFGFHGGYGVEAVNVGQGSVPMTPVPTNPPTTAAPIPVPTNPPTMATPAPVPLTPAPTMATPAPVPAVPALDFQEVPLTGKLEPATFRYHVNRNDAKADGADTITIEFSCPGNVWASAGVSQFGGMAPAITVTGFPESGNLPLLYSMTSKSVAGVNPLPDNEQVLIDPRITFDGDRTTLLYTKPLTSGAPDDVFKIVADGTGSTNFIGACGGAAGPSAHTLYGGAAVTVMDAVGVPIIAPVPAPTIAPVPAPTMAPVPAPTMAPIPALEFQEVPLTGKLEPATFRYHVNRNDAKADGADTITIEFTCPGNVWASAGVSQFGGMAPAITVTGFPESGNLPLLYSMTSKSVAGVNPLPDSEQVLIDPRITFDGDRTTLMYTKPLTSGMVDDVFKIVADGSSITNFIGACGGAPGPSAHTLYGGVSVAVKDTAPSRKVGFRQVPLSGSLAPTMFKYRLNRNDVMADEADTISIEYSCPGDVWVGIGVSEFGAMAPAKAVMGFSGSTPVRYSMMSKEVSGVKPLPDEEQNLIDPQFIFEDGRSTLRFTMPLFSSEAVAAAQLQDESLEIHADGRTNNFIGACGSAPGPSFHYLFGSFGVVLEEGTEAPTAAAPFAAPTNPAEAEVLELDGDLEGSTLSYKFTSEDPNTGGKDSITVTYTAPVTGWVSVGTSESGLMAGADAVIGIPATGEVKKYTLSSKSMAGVLIMPEEKQTLVDVSITQANGMTTLTYTKILVEDGEIPINRAGDNIFIAAHGSSNTLGFHSARGSFSLSGKLIEKDNSLWIVHGWLAGLAWGIFCPLAILAGLFRKYIPGEGRWYQIHSVLQRLVIVLTILSVLVAIIALNKETPDNLSADHFSPEHADGHRSIGLVVLILALVQAANGFMRPHLPPKPEETVDAEEGKKGRIEPPQPAEKTGGRKLWEVLHRLLGVNLLALSWYQIYLGIYWYDEIFNDGESGSTLNAYYAIIGILGALILTGVAMRALMG